MWLVQNCQWRDTSVTQPQFKVRSYYVGAQQLATIHRDRGGQWRIFTKSRSGEISFCLMPPSLRWTVVSVYTKTMIRYFTKKTILFLQRSRYLRTQIAGELLGGECRGIRNLSSQSECASTISSVLVHTNIVYYSNICKIHEVSLFNNTSHD